MNFKTHYILLLAFILMLSCHKDTETFTSESTKVHIPIVYKEIIGSVLGYVYDEKKMPVADAEVAIYSAKTKTNKHGVFTFENIRLDPQGTYIRVSKSGYFHASDFIYPVEQSTTYAYAKILKLDGGVVFDGASGGNITLDGGAKLSFPSNALIDANGVNYNGKVTVFAKYLHPDDRDLGSVMPGGLIGDAAEGQTVILGTLGMIAAELKDNQGNTLKIAQGKNVTIEYPVTSSYKIPEIPLWSFDETKGRWKEEGKAVLIGDKYIGQVGHFSFWNLDAKFPLVDVCGSVLYEDGSPAAHVSIKVEVDGLGVSFGMTNNKGEFCGKMPKSKRLRIVAFHPPCINDIAEINVGPFDVKTVLDKMVIKPIKTFKINGKIQCSDNALSEGIIVIKVKESSMLIKAESNGTFTANITPFTCGEDAQASIFGFDNKTTETSQSVIVTPTSSQNMIINVCDKPSTCDIKADFIYDCSKTLKINASGGSGNFHYTWKDFSSKENTVVISSQDSTYNSRVFCVTVKDLNDNCEKTFCKQIGATLVPGIEVDCNSGKLIAFVRGGLTPYHFKWPDGSTNNTFKPATEGKYCVEISDAMGCKTTYCEEIASPIVVSSKPSSCNKNIFTINSSIFESGKVIGFGINNTQNLSFPIKIDIFKTGLTFAIQLKNKKCLVEQEYVLPHLQQGITTSLINPSCSNCLDGKINVIISNNPVCLDCKVGEIKIFKTDDLTTDLAVVNKDGKMAKGEYYVVVTDANSGCYIYINKVKIQ